MSFFKFLFPLIIILNISYTHGEDKAKEQSSHDSENSHLKDLKTTSKLLLRGSYLQFTKPHTIAVAAASVFTIWLISNNDKKLLRQWGGHSPSDTVEFLGNPTAVMLNLPVLPLSLYEWSRAHDNTKLYNFTLEYTATLYLTLGETFLLSSIPFHKRPDSSGLTFFERTFRLRSSFPSGHMAGVSSLFFKTLQYYGPLMATAPLALTVITAMQRLQSHRHWPSDVFGTFFLAYLASEGTRIAHNKPEHYDRLYRFIYQHQFTLSPAVSTDGAQALISLSF